MPKLHIHGEDNPADDAVSLRLIRISDDEIMLSAVDAEGNCLLDPDSFAHGGGLLTLTADGRISRSVNVMPALGLVLDNSGRIALDAASESIVTRHAQRYGGKRASFRLVKED